MKSTRIYTVLVVLIAFLAGISGCQQPEQTEIKPKPKKVTEVAEPTQKGTPKIEVKKGGIIIPDTAKEKPLEAEVVALGTGKKAEDGKPIPFEVKSGDRILIGKYSGTDVTIDGDEYSAEWCSGIVRHDTN